MPDDFGSSTATPEITKSVSQASRAESEFAKCGFLPVIKLDVINGRISILSMRMRMSPGKEMSIMVSWLRWALLKEKPKMTPSKTPRKVKTSRRWILAWVST